MIDVNDIFDIVAKQAKAERDKLALDTRLADLDIQSLDLVELVFAIEDKYDVSVPYSPNEQNAAGVSFDTVGDVFAAVERLVTEQHPETV